MDIANSHGTNLLKASLLMPIECFEIETKTNIIIKVKRFSEVDYLLAQEAMSEFTSNRNNQDLDQIWLLQHPQVYTLGTACKQDTLLPSSIEKVKSDRGGQITYHGPGQVVMYVLLDLRQHKLGVKSLVAKLELAVINVLAKMDIEAVQRLDAPGVYVNQAKIAALGLRIRRGNSYHGVSLNVDMDLTPFLNIDPCGFQGLEVTQIIDLQKQYSDTQRISSLLLSSFVELL